MRAPSLPAGSDPIEGMLLQAAFLLEANRPAEAVPLLHKALASAPEDTRILCNLAIAYLKLGDPPKALELAGQAVAAEPDDAAGHRLRSQALSAMGQRKPALQAAREAVRCAPEDPDSLVALVEALTLNGKFKEAERTAQTLLKVAPEAADTWAALGLVSLKAKRWKEAEERCRRALALDPESFQAMNNLGVALLNQRRKRREGVDQLERTVALDPAEDIGRRNLKIGVYKYLGTAGLVFVALFQAAGYTLDRKGGEVWGIALAAFAVFGFFMVRWLRFRTLPERVKGFIRTDRRQRIPNLIVKTVAWSFGVFFGLLFLFGLLGWWMESRQEASKQRPAPSASVQRPR